MEFFDQRSIELSGKSMGNLGVVAALADWRAEPFAYLCLHDREDKEVSISHADEIERALPWAQVERTAGLGHNRILNDPDQQIRVRRFVESLIREG
jgi:hypothetical protein